MTGLWITILIVGLATYAMRVMPLLWGRARTGDAGRGGWLDRLGPCLLAAMAATAILPALPTLTHPDSLLDGAQMLAGLSAVLLSMWLRPDPGLATLAGMAAFWLGGVVV